MHWRLGYRPQLDGLRAIAVFLVFADHAGIDAFQGAGQTGVILFFVLSGFLITTLLLEERQRTGSVDLIAFYKRRALRLLPALALLLVFVSALMLMMNRAAELPADVLSTLFYVRNWFTAAGENPGLLSHAWSLSIEEQFYIVWPLLLIGALTWTRGRLLWIGLGVSSVALLVVAWRAVLWAPDTYDRVLWATDTRADGLLIGCALALLFARRRVSVGPIAAAVAAVGIASLRLVNNTDAAVTVGFVVAAAAAAVIIAAAATNRLPVLAWPPLVFLGTISYGLYLFHRPIARIFADLGYGGHPVAVVVVALSSVALAWLSYRFVERPVLRLKHRIGRPTPAPSMAPAR